MLVLLSLLHLASSDIKQDGFSFNGYLNVEGVAENSTNASVSSFSTTFIFAIVPEFIGGHGLAFVISPNDEIPGAYPAQYLGLFNLTNMGNSSNHIIAVELDTFCNMEYHDIDDNHVGIISIARSRLPSGDPMQIWMEYDGVDKQLNVTLHPINIPKPKIPILSLKRDLSPYMYETMYVGFSSSSSSHSIMKSSHYILAWSFKMNGEADELD
ncbi:hypothetical protein V6N13_087777 [Hibiscus sabdariffa]